MGPILAHLNALHRPELHGGGEEEKYARDYSYDKDNVETSMRFYVILSAKLNKNINGILNQHLLSRVVVNSGV